uniref:NADH-ubiquinone oxidoreductase chain 1 n=1 Tax=Duplodicodrilus schmardae TaxID=320986 RepID=A0A142AG21_9ANNE|nr:NADH dehydrogenase subunit 1 [Duplodicodrilus schmardae]AMO27032.1 NADH dehydrogenase subunit 1 [Duplodicodrilus schmardae]
MSMTFFTSILLSLVMALVAMAFYTLMERKFLGYFHLRKGPNKVGLMGIPQPFSDAIKLFVKEQAKPTPANKSPFMVAPTMALILALMMCAIYPHSHQSYFFQFSVLYFLCVSSMNVYATFMAGWSSNSKYALLGALRGVAQTISYEVSMSLILLSALVVVMTMDFTKMTSYSWILLMMMPLSVTWFITNLAETNRSPFDFAEGESELVSGFNIEYSSGLFAMIFMAEYMNILVMSLFTSIIFMSMPNMALSDMILLMKTLMLAMLFVWVRATLPRMRYDHLMNLTWKSFLPLSLTCLMLVFPITMLM